MRNKTSVWPNRNFSLVHIRVKTKHYDAAMTGNLTPRNLQRKVLMPTLRTDRRVKIRHSCLR